MALKSGSVWIRFALLCVLLSVGLHGCEEKTKGPKKGESTTPSPPDTPTGNGPVGDVPETEEPSTGGQLGDAGYMRPLQRPTDTKPDEIVFTPVAIDSAAWFRTCVVAKAQGNSGNIGCTIVGGSHLSTDAPLFELNRSVRWKPQTSGQSVELEFYTYRPTSTANCSTSGCPGPFSPSPSLTKLSGSVPETLKCLKSGSVLVFFYDDQDDSKVASDVSYRSSLSAEVGSVPAGPNLRNLTDQALLDAVYLGDPERGSVSERDVRRKYGIDFDELIMQVDLGTGNYSIKGYESCQ
jgi:hypothetical protein